MVGKIFSIEEFSTFDGPGIRCTIFLKGCPLRCQWCHNPEGQEFHDQILKSQNGCIGCGTCIKSGMTKESIPLCPKGLLRLCGEDISAEALFSKMESRIAMLKPINGGITFSGGEPFSQPAFLKECLTRFQPQIHTAIQTSGYVAPELFQDIAPLADYILFDLKLMNDGAHKHFTGVSNRWILKNYETLSTSGQPFITRIPLIPGVNDTTENLEATAKFMQSNGAAKIELLPYNTAAGGKYKTVGKQYQVEFDENQAPVPHVEIFEKYGIEVTVL